MLPRIAFTPGEPAGIGPDLAIRMAQQDWQAQLCVIADAELLTQRAKQLGLPLTLQPYNAAAKSTANPPGSLSIIHTPLEATVVAGELNPANGSYVVQTLHRASEGNLNGEFDAVVTGPVHKGVINQAGIAFSGHTEYFAQQANCNDVVMLLATEGLRVALVTTHIPLAYVAKAITRERLEMVLRIIHDDFRQKWNIQQPRMIICGLNPHAGEGGHLGREELDVINPTLQQLRLEGMNLVGPLPADTLFQPKYLEQADVVVAMYHDQGLPVLKYKGFGNAVNITLGLPFIRTSVDHGTALDLAGKSEVNDGSCRLAIATAIDMVNATRS